MTLTKKEINLAVAAYHNYCEDNKDGQGYGFSDFTLITQSPEFEIEDIGKRITPDELKIVAEKAGYKTTEQLGPERAYAIRKYYDENDLIEQIISFEFHEMGENIEVELTDSIVEISSWDKFDVDGIKIPYYGEDGIDEISEEELMRKALKEKTSYSEEQIDAFVEILFDQFDVEVNYSWKIPEEETDEDQ